MTSPRDIEICVKLDRTDFTLDVDINIPAEGLTVLFGQSGSGKTTLLRCIAGLEKSSVSNITIADSSWSDTHKSLPSYQRDIGFVFQESSLLPHLDVRGNLRFAQKRAHRTSTTKSINNSVSRKPINEEQVVEVFDLASLLHKKTHQLSGGERQRVAIARALLIQPSVLLLDEPLASLDYKRKQEILPYFEKLKDLCEIPIIYVSHSMDEVSRLADHVVILEHGRSLASGKAVDVFSDIHTPVKLQQDSGVILQGVIAERDEQWHLCRFEFTGNHGLDCGIWLNDNQQEIGSMARLRVLAKDVSITLEKQECTSILNRIPVVISEMAPDGDSMTLVKLAAGESAIIARLSNRSIHELGLAPNQSVWAQIKGAAFVP